MVRQCSYNWDHGARKYAVPRDKAKSEIRMALALALGDELWLFSPKDEDIAKSGRAFTTKAVKKL